MTGVVELDWKAIAREHRAACILLALFLVSGAVVLAACLLNTGQLPDVVDRSLTEQERSEVIARNSPLTDYVYLTSNAGFPREKEIDTITIHHMADDLTLEELGASFARIDRRVSSNYGVDRNGRVGLFVEEENRAWTSSSPENDGRAVTIEVANDTIGEDWHVSDASYEALIDLCVDICRRNGIGRLTYTGDAEGNLTTHNMFADTECPGPYLESRMEEIADTVNKRLNTFDATN